MNKNVKRIIGLAVVLAVIAALVCTVPVMTLVDRRLSGVEWSLSDPDYAKEREVRIEGWYRRYLFKHDKFVGSISVDGYESVGSFGFYDNHMIFEGPTGDFQNLYFRGNFKDVMIVLDFLGVPNDHVISCGAETREEGIAQYRSHEERGKAGHFLDSENIIE